jgi:hypothetical protein
MKAIDLACRKCTQQPGEWCRVVDARTGELGPEVQQMLHAERMEDAGAMTTNDDPVSAEQFGAALERSGMV